MPQTEAKPASSVIDASMTRPDATRGALAVTRDAGFEGAACAHRISLDGKPVADLKPGETVTLYASAGEHTLTMTVQGALCPTIETALTVQADPAGRPRRPHRYTTRSANLQARLIPAP